MVRHRDRVRDRYRVRVRDRIRIPSAEGGHRRRRPSPEAGGVNNYLILVLFFQVDDEKDIRKCSAVCNHRKTRNKLFAK